MKTKSLVHRSTAYRSTWTMEPTIKQLAPAIGEFVWHCKNSGKILTKPEVNFYLSVVSVATVEGSFSIIV